MAYAKDTGFNYTKPNLYEELKKEVQQIKKPKPTIPTYQAPTAAQEVEAAKKEQIAINNTPAPAPKPPTQQSTIIPVTTIPGGVPDTAPKNTIIPDTTPGPIAADTTSARSEEVTPFEQPVDEGPSIADMIQQMNDAIKSDDPPHYHPNMVQLSEEEMNEPIATEKAE